MDLDMTDRSLQILRDLHQAAHALRMTAPVDDDFPEMMHNFDSEVKAAGKYLEAIGGASELDETEQFILDFRAELNRARTKLPGRRIMTIALAEEFGELAKAVLDEPLPNVRKEAVQCAVMAARVAIDGDESTDAWRDAKGLGRTGTN